MKRIGLAVLSLSVMGACALGTMSSRVEQKTQLDAKTDRTVVAERWGVGIVTEQPLNTPGRESIDTAIAGAIDRSPGLYGPYGMYGGGLYGPYSASGQILPYGAGLAHLIGGYTAAGMARAAELQPLISPATPTYQIIQAPPIPVAPPAPPSGGGGGGQGGGAVSPPAPATGAACISRELLGQINAAREAFLRTKATKPLNLEAARVQLEKLADLVDDAYEACQSSNNRTAAKDFEIMLKEIEKFDTEIRLLEEKREGGI